MNMKILTFFAEGKVRRGIVEGEYVIDEEGKGRSYKITEVKILPPVQPTAIFCTLTNSYKMVGASSKEEAREMLRSPKFFLKLPTIVIGYGDTVIAPKSGIRPEVEIGIVIGKKVKNITKDKVKDVIIGYTVFNDVTAPGEYKEDWYYALRRDPTDGIIKKVLNRGTHFRNKNRDTFAPMGPYLVTPEEVNLDGAKMRSYYDDELVQDGTTEEFIFDIEEIISELSKVITIPEMSVVTTGTVGYINAEEVTEFKLPAKSTEMAVEVEGLGRLINPVSPEEG